MSADRTLADVGEFGVIAELVARYPQGEHVFLGPGDDAAVLRIKRAHVVVSTDLSIEGRHFRREWSSAADVGHRTAARNLADIAAMGGTAHSLTVAIAAPADTPVSWVLDFASAFAEEASVVGASVVGGDLSQADQIVIAVTVLGSVEAAPVTRSGAKPGDVLALAGRQGWAAGGLAVLGRGFTAPRALVEALRRPAVPYAAGPQAAELGATALIDVSDGLLADAGHIASSSGVGIDVRTSALDVPEPLHTLAAATGTEALSYVLAGGDDHALLATFPAGTELPDGWRVIGTVDKVGPEGPRVTVDDEPYNGSTGWTHF